MPLSHALDLFGGAIQKIAALKFVEYLINIYQSRQDGKPIIITGEWFVEYSEEGPLDRKGLEVTWDLRVDLKQRGCRVTGKATATCTSEKGSKHVCFDVSGKFYEHTLDLSLRGTGENSMNRSILLLKLRGGSVLSGSQTFLGRGSDEIRTIECDLLPCALAKYHSKATKSGCAVA
jgi:hypothetical protein